MAKVSKDNAISWRSVVGGMKTMFPGPFPRE